MTLEIANTSIINNGIVVSDNGNLFANTLSVQRYYNTLGGMVEGYSSGALPSPASNQTLKFPFAVSSGGSSTTLGSLTVSRLGGRGQSSTTHGYTSGGSTDPAAGTVNVIDRFSFTSSASAVDVGDLTVTRYQTAAHSSVAYGFGYNSGGDSTDVTGTSNVIDRFPFAVATTNATDVGDLSAAKTGVAGCSSSDFGYAAGGVTPSPTIPTVYNVIDRFPFAIATTNTTDVGDLSATTVNASGQSSAEYGFLTGGRTVSTPATTYTTKIDSFPFASALTNASAVGNLATSTSSGIGVSSVNYGYNVGGIIPGAASTTSYVRFAFSSGSVSVSTAGSLTAARRAGAGNQI